MIPLVTVQRPMNCVWLVQHELRHVSLFTPLSGMMTIDSPYFVLRELNILYLQYPITRRLGYSGLPNAGYHRGTLSHLLFGAYMATTPIPLFEAYNRFPNLNFSRVIDELPLVSQYLFSFPSELKAQDGYLAVRGFLKSYSNNEATFNSYRTHFERLLLWSLLIAKNPLLELKRHDCESFLEFCLQPRPEWIGPVVKSRFTRVGGRKATETDTYIINDKWRPFNVKIDKQIRKVAAENCKDLDETAYKMSAGSMGQVFAVCGSFFQYSIDEGLTADANPIRSVKQKSNFKQRNTVISSGKALTPLQWNYVIEAAEVMAAEDPRHERTLFIVATLFSLYLRISDLVGRDNWKPMCVQALSHQFYNSVFNVVGAQWLAKIYWPDAFAGLDPDAEYRRLIRERDFTTLPDLPFIFHEQVCFEALDTKAGWTQAYKIISHPPRASIVCLSQVTAANLLP